MTTGAEFSTPIGLVGTWPDPPKYWSYSSLTEAEACPRRFGLRRATYPDLWDRHGYPDRVTESTIAGTAVHDAVESILRALKVAGCTSLADRGSVDVLRELGGYTSIASSAADSALATLEGNPRMRPHAYRLAEKLCRRIPEMRRAVQTLVSRVSLGAESPSPPGERPGYSPAGRGRVGVGVHPEVPLIAEEQRFAGRVDLLTVGPDRAEVLDFKTGAPADHHSDQVRLYGLLWMLDGVANPDHLAIQGLTVAYVDREESVSVPDAWDAQTEALEDRISRANSAVTARPPKAVPSPGCKFCAVRHMCDEYWCSPFADLDPTSNFGDVEVDLLGRNGPKSWMVRIGGSSEEALLRTQSETEEFELGGRLRLLDVAIGAAEDDGALVATVTSGSEVFALVSE